MLGTLPNTEDVTAGKEVIELLEDVMMGCGRHIPCCRVLVRQIGPPTSIGESVFREFVGLLVRLCRGVCVPEEGESALIEPSDWEAAECALFKRLDDRGLSVSESVPVRTACGL